MELSCTKIVNMPDNTKPKDKAQILLMLIYMTRIVIITWFLAKIYWCANPWRDKKDNHEKEIILLRVKITAWKAFQITRLGFKHLIVLFEAICNNSKTKIFPKKNSYLLYQGVTNNSFSEDSYIRTKWMIP